ncbi:hypothetical protein PIB30_075168 [Stylosanthes scabra]|uniref:PB1-like domain-containing protein n=1 Tax=Stylosanthes scabra TaxID=79078 RepID=A0ABU6VSG3_9FABA|nr:hypothetical protein [Stylosanthes scabra]
MGDRYVVLVFHHGGSLVRHPNGELVYANGAIERFDDVEIDIDTINLGDLVKLYESLGSYEAVHWLDKEVPELETGLNELVGNQDIRDLCDWLRLNAEGNRVSYICRACNQPASVS